MKNTIVTRAELYIDDFTSKKEIVSEYLGNLTTYYNDDHKFLFINLINKDSKDFLKLSYDKGAYKLSLGDKLSILLENGHILNYDIIKEPYNGVNGVVATIQLSRSDIESIAEHKLAKLRIEDIKTGHYQNYGIHKTTETYDWSRRDEKDYQPKEIPVKEIVKDYFFLVAKEIEDYKPLELYPDEKAEPISSEEQCFVYLMIDLTNNFHKIGISNKPKFREKTLQSEKPTIEMICNKKYPNRKLASSIEQALHQTYGDKRIRGEWFDLDEKEIKELKIVLS